MVRRRRNFSVERAGVNAVVSLLEAAGHIVHQVDGTKDHGMDLYVQLVTDGQPSGAHIAVQVKSGCTYRRSVGYAIPVGKHAEIWRTTNLPVVGVVYDPDMRMLYWCNVTGYLRGMPNARSVPVGEEQVLTRGTITEVLAEACGLIHPVDHLGRAKWAMGRHGSAGRFAASRKNSKRSTVGGTPNQLFSFIAGWVERKHEPVRQAGLIASGATIVLSAVVTLVLVHRFAEKHASTTDPWVWTVTVAGFASFALMAAHFEYAAGRPSMLLRGLGVVPLVAYCSLSQVELSSGVATTISTFGYEFASKGMLLLALLFVLRELARRRRMRAAYGSPTARDSSTATDV